MEASLRVFDRHGEREKRHKARLKFLIKKIGIDEFKNLVDQERAAIKNKSFEVPQLPDNSKSKKAITVYISRCS